MSSQSSFAVLDAVAEHGVAKVGIPDISRRAGVRDSSIYRRWGTRENLVLDVMLTARERTLPLPDTGTLHGDLTAFEVAANLASRPCARACSASAQVLGRRNSRTLPLILAIQGSVVMASAPDGPTRRPQ
ncbi:TetR/AcrR family transcriptional regulator [Nocardia sp. NPDC052278]|uniref:TetR/AcrR family transcriptional regulator n=1 Tax=unclassified Nocardia TaxID=2637762 RepID=UPI0036A6EB6C